MPDSDPTTTPRRRVRRSTPALCLALASVGALAIHAPATAHQAAGTPARPDTAGLETVQPPAPLAPENTDAPAPPKRTADSGAQTPVNFEADKIEYDDKADTVTAAGNVVIKQQDTSLRADSVRWDRKSGKILATGHVHSVDANGNETYADTLTTNDAFVTGALENVLVVLREGGRLVSTGARRDAQGNITLSHAAYSSCDVVDDTGCPVKPAWRINARSVFYDPKRAIARMYGARAVFFGAVSIPLPKLEVATDGRSISGLLIPNVSTSSANGFGFSDGYFQRLGPNRDLTVTGYVFTKADPMAEVEYRSLTAKGAYQITGYVTSSQAVSAGNTGNGSEQVRGYVDANGAFQLSPEWSVAFSGRLVSDRTFLQRYYINYDDVLRSTISAQRVGDNSFFEIAGWAFQTLRPNEVQGQVPIALPAIDWRRRIKDPWLGGTIEIEANSLAITRSAGEDTQRAFTSAQWTLSRYTDWGQRITFTGLLRGDVDHASNVASADEAIYAGAPGWHARGEALAAVDITWPLAGTLLGGTQVLTPHVQVVAVPPAHNSVIANEDSRADELTDDNLFALNRFPGYDRIEDGVHMTYGFDWMLNRHNWQALATVGQSVRFTSINPDFDTESGLYNKWSDIVGRVQLRYKDFFTITERFRLDHNTFVSRRNEIDATIGSERTYFEVGYARVNDLLAATLNDLPESNELRGSARVAFAKYWSLFGSGVFDLSQSNLIANTGNKPFQPLRTRIGVAYQSDCFAVDVTWRKDYVTIGDAVAGSSFLIHFSLRNIGMH